MRATLDGWADTVAGSHQRLLRVDAIFDDDVAVENLEVVGGSVIFDDDRDLIRSGTVVISSPDGMVSPDVAADALAAYGQELDISAGAVVNGEDQWVRFGRQRIDRAVPKDTFGWRGGRYGRIGSVIEVTLVDQLAYVADARFLAPEQPSGLCLSEIRRLARDIMPVGAFDGITDQAVPGKTVYPEDRIAALRTLAFACDAKVVSTDYGYLDVVPLVTTGAPVATLSTWIPPKPTDDQAPPVVVEVEREITRDEVYNAVIARGEATSDKAPVQQIAYDTTSPARWDGPFGRKPYIHSSPFYTTVARAAAGATTRLNSLIAGRDQIITVYVIPNAALEVRDLVAVRTPVATYTGRITRIEFPLGLGLMKVSVRVRLNDVALVDQDIT